MQSNNIHTHLRIAEGLEAFDVMSDLEQKKWIDNTEKYYVGKYGRCTGMDIYTAVIDYDIIYRMIKEKRLVDNLD